MRITRTTGAFSGLLIAVRPFPRSNRPYGVCLHSTQVNSRPGSRREVGQIYAVLNHLSTYRAIDVLLFALAYPR